MIIIHDMNALARLATGSVERVLRALPVAVVTGARQTGKTTLVRELMHDRDRRYFTLDDLDVRDQAARAPDDLLGRATRLTIDEVQREPSLLLGVKRAVDRARRRGQFVLTGSANLMLMRGVSETLAGRAAYVTLWPLTRSEQRGLGRAGLWTELFDAADENWPAVLADHDFDEADWRQAAIVGGYPTPALELDSAEDRNTWFAGYTRTYLERDLADLSSISALPDFRRLMQAACLRLGQLVNQTELGRDVALPQPTVHRWLNLLETSYQLVRIPAYSVNRTKRLIKTAKLYWADCGLAMHLSGASEAGGAHLENLVLCDLLAWRDASVDPPTIAYWRTAAGEEVDFVIDWKRQLLPVEIKATNRPRVEDARHLQSFRREYGRRARAGLLLHAGSTLDWLAPGILAAPWWRVV